MIYKAHIENREKKDLIWLIVEADNVIEVSEVVLANYPDYKVTFVMEDESTRYLKKK